jgi:rhomboid family GlyGly-CTERM serine protease
VTGQNIMNSKQERNQNETAGYFIGIPLALVFLSILIFSSPALTSLLQYDLTAIKQGEIWRLLTGHFTHWNFEHLFYDVLMFAVFGTYCYKENRKVFFIIIISVPLITSTAIMLFDPEMLCYRGLSGIDTGLFAYTAVTILKKAKQNHENLILSVSVIMLVLLIGKSIFELCTGTTVFVSNEGFTPAPVAHLTGIVTVLLILGIIPQR